MFLLLYIYLLCLGDVGDLVGKVVYGYDPVSPYGTLQPYIRNGSATDTHNYDDRPEAASPSGDDDQRGQYVVITKIAVMGLVKDGNLAFVLIVLIQLTT